MADQEIEKGKRRKKREPWCEDLWQKIVFSGGAKRMNQPDTGSPEWHCYIEAQPPDEGYHPRGDGPVTWVKDPKDGNY